MRTLRLHIMPHPKYSDNPKKQQAMEEGIDAMTESILDLCACVIQKRLSQFAQTIAEAIENKPCK